MKKKTKLLIPSLLTILGCITISAGSTYSLFTSSSSNNISISSGKVEIEAIVDESSYKYKALGDTDFTSSQSMYSGSFSVNEGKVLLNNLSIGDGVSFDIKINNKSNIKTYYKMGLSYDLSKSDASLIEALSFKMDYDLDGTVNTNLPNYETYKSKYYELSDTEKRVNVSISLEDSSLDQSYLMDKTIELSFSVEAIQANGVDINNNNEVKEGKELRIVTPSLNTTSDGYIIPRDTSLGDNPNGLRKDNVYYFIKPGDYTTYSLFGQDFGSDVTLDFAGSTFNKVQLSNNYNKETTLFTIKNLNATTLFAGQALNGNVLLDTLSLNQLAINNHSTSITGDLTISNSTFKGSGLTDRSFADGSTIFIQNKALSEGIAFKSLTFKDNVILDAYKNSIQMDAGNTDMTLDFKDNTFKAWGYENNRQKAKRAAIKIYNFNKYTTSSSSATYNDSSIFNSDAKTLINNSINYNTFTSLSILDEDTSRMAGYYFEVNDDNYVSQSLS